jgi:SAM-dependent methyltransferase
MDRDNFLRSLINVNGYGLEIGPSFGPLVRKSSGAKVEVVDYADANTLRDHYKGSKNVNIANIEEVDYVVQRGSILEAIGKQKYYDYIVASHVIEHTPDLLGFLKDCERLLKDDGILLLAVPDKRHCFDVFQPLTSTGSILQAHIDGRTRPTPGAIFDDRAYNALRNGEIGWPIGATGELRFYLSLSDAQSSFVEARRTTVYTDVHSWRFVPSSFRLIINDLHEIGEISLREDRFFDSVGNEFYATLSSRGQGCPVDRLTLAKRMLVEQAQISAV